MNVAANQSAHQAASARLRDRVIYYPVTDRFHDGDPSNNDPVDAPHALNWQGGDIKGLTQKLDYIKETCGEHTAIWLTPPLKQTDLGVFGEYRAAGFHLYWIKNHDELEARQATPEDMRTFVQECKRKGIALIIDLVLNHVGPDHPWKTDETKKTWLHQHGDIQDGEYEDEWKVRNKNLGGLPDIAHENPEARGYLVEKNAKFINQLQSWADEVETAPGVQGKFEILGRIDATKHMDPGDLQTTLTELKAAIGRPEMPLIGEMLHGNVDKLLPYQDATEHQFDMPFYYTIRETIGQDQPMTKLADRFREDSKYRDVHKQVTLLDNHDHPRFMHTAVGSEEEKISRLKLGMVLLMSMRGIPSVYYGTEAAMHGGNDPDNRRMMEFGRREDVRDHFRGLVKIRNEHAALRHGEQLEMWVDEKVYAYARRLDDQEAIAILNNAGDTQHRTIPLRHGSPFQNGQKLVDAVSGREYEVKDGKLQVELDAKSGAILVAKKD